MRESRSLAAAPALRGVTVTGLAQEILDLVRIKPWVIEPGTDNLCG
jgi:hypothetical protein